MIAESATDQEDSIVQLIETLFTNKKWILKHLDDIGGDR